MWWFINWQITVECVVISLLFASFLNLISFKCLGILQGLGYKGAKLFKWAGAKSNQAYQRFGVLTLAMALSSAVIGLCFSFAGAHWSGIISLTGFLIFFVLYVVADARHTFKSGAVLTPRFKRLFACTFLVYAVIVYLVVTTLNFCEYVWGANLFATLKYCTLSVLPLLVVPVVCLANLISKCWETPINNSYIKKAQKKLTSLNLTVVGITGSYGKTSAKNILAHLLQGDFKVTATPSSYNTPLGIAKTVNNATLENGGVLIAEMGARNKGDIAALCKLCPPDYSLITGICPQHLESFKTIENVIATKGEIIAATKKICFIADDCAEKFKDIAGEKQACGCVSDVVADSEGTSFTITLGGESARAKCKLLGEHNAYNIGLCARLAYEMGVSVENIVNRIATLEFTEHRLQHILSNGVHILDDGYNSNVVGARAALKVLRSFGGKKIVVTPGLVELGVLEESENEALGAELVGLDSVILVGVTLVTAVKNGYIKAGGDSEKLQIVPTLASAQDILKDILSEGDAVLFLNDLPEIYN